MIEAKYEALQSAIGEGFLKATKTSKPKTPEEAQQMQLTYAAVSKYFYQIYGDLWLRGLDSQAEQFWRLHLIGLSMDNIAGGIQRMIELGKTQFPPNPLEFRGYCLHCASKNGQSDSTISQGNKLNFL